jgi:hypothetical protein
MLDVRRRIPPVQALGPSRIKRIVISVEFLLRSEQAREAPRPGRPNTSSDEFTQGGDPGVAVSDIGHIDPEKLLLDHRRPESSFIRK